MLEWFELEGDLWIVHIEYDTDRLLSTTIDAVEHALDIILEAFGNNNPLSSLQDGLRSTMDVL